MTEQKPSRSQIQIDKRREKAKIRIEKKSAFRAKAEKKLVEKAKRKASHKKQNAMRKLEKKQKTGGKERQREAEA